MAEVKLHGAVLPSPFVYRVIWALKLKGVPYEFVAEDLSNKSGSLLKYNPVHKKIPVLVHGGKPVCESMVILEYIEETWPQNPLMPNNPYDRALARFWIKFAEDKVQWELNYLNHTNSITCMPGLKLSSKSLINMTEVKLHGVLLSPYVYRVIWALKLKGVPYEFVAEDLSNKSDLLLKYNPVYKKIPVLVHGEKPVSESMVILEYIEEMWPQNPSLMPNDPYDRALARFWIKFIEDKVRTTTLIVAILGLFRSITGQELENATKELLEILQTLEEHGLGEKIFFNGDNIGLVDIAFGSMLFWMQVIGDVVGVKPFESHKFPSLHAWFENFKQIPVIEENFPNRHEYFVYIKRRREELLASA
ncbi:hypothetical protein CUMW_065850 [Citrus unshiu]|nr:hypothetical protein CUMW_065850 [Citrus unshiu]